MHIGDYRFGSIQIDEKTYHADLIILPDAVKDRWWRKEGHRLQIDDLDDAIAAHPDVLVVGTGYYGRMQIPEETRRFLREQGIELREAKTSEAVEAFRQLQAHNARIVAALHLSC